MTPSIPKHASDLRVSDQTTHAEVVAYLDARLGEPATVGDAVVFNFNSHDLDAHALLDAGLDDGVYVVPYQVAGMWGTMVEMLPRRVAAATLLTYRQGQGEYATYPNLLAEGPDDEARQRLRAAMQQALSTASSHGGPGDAR